MQIDLPLQVGRIFQQSLGAFLQRPVALLLAAGALYGLSLLDPMITMMVLEGGFEDLDALRIKLMGWVAISVLLSTIVQTYAVSITLQAYSGQSQGPAGGIGKALIGTLSVWKVILVVSVIYAARQTISLFGLEMPLNLIVGLAVVVVAVRVFVALAAGLENPAKGLGAVGESFKLTAGRYGFRIFGLLVLMALPLAVLGGVLGASLAGGNNLSPADISGSWVVTAISIFMPLWFANAVALVYLRLKEIHGGGSSGVASYLAPDQDLSEVFD